MRPGRGIRVAACLALVAAAAGAGAESPPAADGIPFAAPAAQPVTVELISEHVALQEAGTTRIGVRFTIADGWHIYAEHPGDAGMPTTIAWAPVTGARFGPLVWPPPETFQDPGEITTHGYTHDTVLASTLTHLPTPGHTARELPITASVKWLACQAICIPGSAQLSMTLPISGAPGARTPEAARFGERH